MVRWTCNNAKDVQTKINNILRVSTPLRPCVKLMMRTQRREGAKKGEPQVTALSFRAVSP